MVPSRVRERATKGRVIIRLAGSAKLVLSGPVNQLALDQVAGEPLDRGRRSFRLKQSANRATQNGQSNHSSAGSNAGNTVIAARRAPTARWRQPGSTMTLE
jgi:hypothetical protein